MEITRDFLVHYLIAAVSVGMTSNDYDISNFEMADFSENAIEKAASEIRYIFSEMDESLKCSLSNVDKKNLSFFIWEIRNGNNYAFEEYLSTNDSILYQNKNILIEKISKLTEKIIVGDDGKFDYY